ncbi:hypothetical protein TNCV_2086271 [Trichonephila clavipes]|nr:hypothetical protein TNCV_2086271 [Trichonephila clavipes]
MVARTQPGMRPNFQGIVTNVWAVISVVLLISEEQTISDDPSDEAELAGRSISGVGGSVPTLGSVSTVVGCPNAVVAMIPRSDYGEGAFCFASGQSVPIAVTIYVGVSWKRKRKSFQDQERKLTGQTRQNRSRYTTAQLPNAGLQPEQNYDLNKAANDDGRWLSEEEEELLKYYFSNYTNEAVTHYFQYSYSLRMRTRDAFPRHLFEMWHFNTFALDRSRHYHWVPQLRTPL